MSDVICLPERRARRDAAKAPPPPEPSVADLRAAAHLVRNYALKLHAAAPDDVVPARLMSLADFVDREADGIGGEGDGA